VVTGVTAALTWLVRLQAKMSKIDSIEDDIKAIHQVQKQINDLVEQSAEARHELNSRISTNERILAEVAPLVKSLSTTLTKVTTIVEILMEERKNK